MALCVGIFSTERGKDTFHIVAPSWDEAKAALPAAQNMSGWRFYQSDSEKAGDVMARALIVMGERVDAGKGV